MAATADLHTGMTVYVNAGPFKGSTGSVINPRAIPDGLPNQRRVLVWLDDEGIYLLPRLLSIEPPSTEPPSTEPPSTPVAKEAPTRCRTCNGVGWILP
jgi:hypothetical protein